MHSVLCTSLPGSTNLQVEEQYRRDMIAVHGEGAAAMEDEYKSFLRDLGGDVPLVPRWVKGWCGGRDRACAKLGRGWCQSGLRPCGGLRLLLAGRQAGAALGVSHTGQLHDARDAVFR